MKLSRSLLFFLQLILVFFANAQKENEPIITRYTLDKDTSIYFVIRDFWKANEELSYITFPVVQPLKQRRIRLQDDEGRNGYKFETKINFRYPLLQPRANSATLAKATRITLDYSTNFRMTGDESSPLTPASQDVGLGFDWAVWNSKTGVIKNMLEKGNVEGLGNGTFKSLTFSVQTHHYSNGQPAGFFLSTADSTQKRNDYIKGDFSTNYVRLGALFNLLTKDNSLYSAKLWSRFDGDLFGFEFTPEQQFRYGQNRVGLTLDYYSKPLARKKTQKWVQGDKEYTLKRLYTWHFRASSETILGKLQLFESNLLNDSRKFRTNLKLEAHYQPLSSNAVGLYSMFYIGRDYLNIRYDDIIWTVQGGLTIRMGRYYPPRWNSSESIMNK